MENVAAITHRPIRRTIYFQRKGKKVLRNPAVCQKGQHCTLSNGVGSNQCIQHCSGIFATLAVARPSWKGSGAALCSRKSWELHHTDVEQWQCPERQGISPVQPSQAMLQRTVTDAERATTQHLKRVQEGFIVVSICTQAQPGSSIAVIYTTPTTLAWTCSSRGHC